MSLTTEQKEQLSKLLSHRDDVVGSLFEIEQILKKYFPEEFDVAYQHWIPQIITALYDNKKWLPRGDQTMEKSIQRIRDKDNNGKGVYRYI
jgi:hypothetical protein